MTKSAEMTNRPGGRQDAAAEVAEAVEVLTDLERPDRCAASPGSPGRPRREGWTLSISSIGTGARTVVGDLEAGAYAHRSVPCIARLSPPCQRVLAARSLRHAIISPFADVHLDIHAEVVGRDARPRPVQRARPAAGRARRRRGPGRRCRRCRWWGRTRPSRRPAGRPAPRRGCGPPPMPPVAARAAVRAVDVSGHEPGREAEAAHRLDHQDREVAAAAAPKRQRLQRASARRSPGAWI